MTHLHEAPGQHVLHVATQELVDRQRQGFALVLVGIILVTEGHLAVFEMLESGIAESYSCV